MPLPKPMMHTLLLRAASRLVPQSQRSEWLREWVAELIYLQRSSTRVSATAFCLGAFHDAVMVRSQADPVTRWHDALWIKSATTCLLLLTLLAIVAAWVLWASPAVRACVWPHPLRAHAVIAAAAMAFYLLAPGTPRYQVNGFRSWCFMMTKLAILTVIVYCVSFDIVPLISRGPIPPQIALMMYVLAYRWALQDQQQRCPVCLGLLTSPVRIGHSAGTLLEWYGAELVCSKGHGVLHEPEPLASSYCARRWVTLDASWQELFR